MGDSEPAYPPVARAAELAQPAKELLYDADSPELDEARKPTTAEDDTADEEGPLLQGLINEGARRGSVENEVDLEGTPFRRKGGGLAAGIANMANSILGAGIVGLPFALSQSGFWAGCCLLIVLGAATDWTVRIIAISAKLSSTATYIDIMDAAFGKPGRAACSIFQLTFAFGGMCAFSIVLGDTIPKVLLGIIPIAWQSNAIIQFIFSRNIVVTFFTLTISYPLALHRDIEKLSRASGMALVSMAVILSVVAVHGPALSLEYKGPTDQRWTIIKSGIPSAVGVISFAYVCHHNSLLIYGSLSRPTLDRFNQLTHISTIFSAIASLAMAICGYLVFTSKTQGNILNNFPSDDGWANLARLCFGANMFATLPLECFVCREVFETYCFPGAEFNAKRHFISTTVLVLASLAVSLFITDLGAILEIAGATAACFLAYVFPAACYLKLASGLRPATIWLGRICIVFGVINALLVIGKVVIKLSRNAIQD